ncbi:MAG: hypothetical protein ACRCYS_13925, partial [Beijerinckiaceae bacterium]
MGISSGRSTTKPIYSGQVEGAAKNMSDAYNTAAPRIQGAADQISGLLPSLIGRAQNGDPAIDAARGYITQTLGRDPSSNPNLQPMIDQTNRSVASRTLASLGTRGLSGGSAMADMMSRAMLENETGLRYNDYNAEMQRRQNAAAMAPGISGATNDLLNPALNAAQATMMPVQAAAANAAGVGGLLGQYTQTKTSQPWGSALLGALAGGAGAYFG